MTTHRNIQKAHDQLLFLGELTAKFADIHRAVVYPDGHYENDAEHSFHLALSATEIAASYHAKLDIGLVSQFSIVHDLPEVYAGDVPSFGMSEEAKVAKEKAEKAATKKLLKELPLHTAQLLERYEEQREPEARFVRLIDKILPVVMYSIALETNREEFIRKFDINTAEELDAANERYFDKLQAMFPEFDFALLLRKAAAATHRNRVFPGYRKD